MLYNFGIKGNEICLKRKWQEMIDREIDRVSTSHQSNSLLASGNLMIRLVSPFSICENSDPSVQDIGISRKTFCRVFSELERFKVERMQ